MAVNTFPQIPGPAYIRTFPRPSPFRRFPVNGPQVTILSLSYSIVTLATLRARIRERLLATFWADAELNAYIAEAFRIWNTLTGYWRTTYSQNIGQGDFWFNMNENIPDHIALLRVYTTTGNIKLVSLDELDAMSTTWQSSSTGTTIYAAVTGLNYIAASPAESGTTTLLFDIVKKAPIPTSDGDYIQIGEEDLEAILGYVYFVAKLKEGTSELKDSLYLLQKFLEGATKYNSKITSISSYRQLMGIPGDAHVIRANARAKTPWRDF